MPSLAEFRRFFSIPREPHTARAPGQYFELTVARGKRVIITDIYVENLGGGNAALEILEQRLPTSFELRYVFNTKANQVLSINLATGLRLGDLTPIKNTVRIQNGYGSSASILVRVNGQWVG
jgi:hypothetical protein